MHIDNFVVRFQIITVTFSFIIKDIYKSDNRIIMFSINSGGRDNNYLVIRDR